MLFNSYIFIFLFLPITLLGWFILNHFRKYTQAKVFLAGMSLWFYSYANIWYLLLILCSVCGNYVCSFLMKKAGRTEALAVPDDVKASSQKSKKIIGIIGILFNLGLLFYFKYYDFFISNMNSLFQKDWALKNIALPLGISFFTFQQISFLADRMKGDAPHYSFLDYIVFVTYFPQLVAGPIVKHSLLIPQFNDEAKKKWNADNFAKGILLFVFGLSKKLLIADTIAFSVDYGYSNIASLDSVTALLTMLFYTFQIFFDFSGYCDMALGMGLMMNITLPLNFDSPYKSRSIKEFWNRWHITLNQFFTEYVYIPLGGSRKGKLRTAINVMIVFFLSGLWHGADWSFVLWGVAHGLLLVLQRLTTKSQGKKHSRDSLDKTIALESGTKETDAKGTSAKENSVKGTNAKETSAKETAWSWFDYLKWFGTFLFVNLAWILFRSDSISQAKELYQKLFSFTWNGSLVSMAYAVDDSVLQIPVSLIKRINGDYVLYFYVAVLIFNLLLACFLCTRKSAYRIVTECSMKTGWAVFAAVLFVLSVLALSNVSPFLYSNF